MSPPTPPPPASSNESAPAFILRPERSCLLPLWWWALHLVLLAAVAGLGVPAPAKIALAVVVLAHGWRRQPSAHTDLLILRPDGRWAWPERGLTDLRLGPDSRYTSRWARLVLVGAGPRWQILLLKDQLDPLSWRRLQAELGRADVGAAAGATDLR